MPDLNPDSPHSPERTAELGQLFDDCSRAIVYSSMPGKGGLQNPGDAYRLIADLYAATSRLPQTCIQLTEFLQAQAATGRLYEARDREISEQVDIARFELRNAAIAARNLTTALQHAQTAIAGLGVREDTTDDA